MAVVTKTKSNENGACKNCPPAHAVLCTSFEEMCGRAQNFADEETKGTDDVWYNKPRFRGDTSHEDPMCDLESDFKDGSGRVYNPVLDNISHEECQDRWEVLRGVNKPAEFQIYSDRQNGMSWEELADKYGYDNESQTKQAYSRVREAAEMMPELYTLRKWAIPLNEEVKKKRMLPKGLLSLLWVNIFPDIGAERLAQYLGEDPVQMRGNVQSYLRKLEGEGVRIYIEDGVICLGEPRVKHQDRRVEIPLRPEYQTQISMN